MVGSKTSAKPTPVASPEGDTTLEASVHPLFGDHSGPGKAQLQESYYKLYTFMAAQNAMREAIERSKKSRI